jgi:ABC-type uncharacterized transport system ATPase subunit
VYALLDGLSFRGFRGTIFELLHPTSGRAQIEAFDMVTHPLDVHRRIPMVLQETAVVVLLRICNNLLTCARFRGLGRREARQRAYQVMPVFGLVSEANREVQDLCRGYRPMSQSEYLVGKVLFNVFHRHFADDDYAGARHLAPPRPIVHGFAAACFLL